MVSVLATAFKAPIVDVVFVVLAARTTYSDEPYAKKLAAVKNVSALLDVGLPNVATRLFSLFMRTLSPTGPQRKTPAIAPVDVATPGTPVVKSISVTFTPGLT
jgi:hypothetical protein